MKQKIGIASIALLVVAFLVYSTTGVFTKLASGEVFLSIGYLSYFVLVMLTMGIYAILWQIALKRVSLTQAYLFKGTTVLFSLVLAALVFHECITWKNVLGAGLIVFGIVVNSQSESVV